MQRRSKSGLPEPLPGGDIKRTEASIKITNKHQPATSRQRAGQEQRTLFNMPALFHRVQIPGSQSAELSPHIRHRKGSGISAVATRSRCNLYLSTSQLGTELMQRDDQRSGFRAVGRCLPVVPAVYAGTGVNRITDTGAADIIPINHSTIFSMLA